MSEINVFTPERLEELSIGYDLDGGGYGFSNPSLPELARVGAAVWDDFDSDYVPWANGDDGRAPWDERGMSRLYAFRPVQYFETVREEWPEIIQDPGDPEVRYRLLRHGVVTESERECSDCEAGKRKPCGRCGDGEGYVLSDAGIWATYAWEETPEEQEE